MKDSIDTLSFFLLYPIMSLPEKKLTSEKKITSGCYNFKLRNFKTSQC